MSETGCVRLGESVVRDDERNREKKTVKVKVKVKVTATQTVCDAKNVMPLVCMR